MQSKLRYQIDVEVFLLQPSPWGNPEQQKTWLFCHDLLKKCDENTVDLGTYCPICASVGQVSHLSLPSDVLLWSQRSQDSSRLVQALSVRRELAFHQTTFNKYIFLQNRGQHFTVLWINMCVQMTFFILWFWRLQISWENEVKISWTIVQLMPFLSS